MKTTTIFSTLAVLALSASVWMLHGQEAGAPPDQRQRQQRPTGPPPDGQRGPGMQGGQGGMGQRMPQPPLMTAIDANHDGTLDEGEISNSAVALRSLDKNSDGKLTPEELRPNRPPGQRGPGQGGQGGQGPGPNGQGGQRGPRDQQSPDGQRPPPPPPNI